VLCHSSTHAPQALKNTLVGVRPNSTLRGRIKIRIIYDLERARQEQIQPSFNLSSNDDYMKVEAPQASSAIL
jgi:hypothetical protein